MEYTKKNDSAVSIATDHIPFLLLLLLQFLSMPLQSAAVSADALPAGCQQTCGDVKIPYPFGIGKDCSRDGFALNCSSIDDGTYKPFFGNVEILSISLSLGHVRMNNHISSTCYNSTNRTADYDDWELNLTGTPYRFSDVHNKFTTIGCETLAYLLSSDGRSDFESGCVSWCGSVDSFTDGSCAGIGCCQTAIPKNISFYEVFFDQNFNSSDVWTFSPCSYAVLMEAAAFEFRRMYVTTDEFGRKYQEVPLVVDWAVRNNTCRDARRNMTSYACVSEHSECVDSVNGPGYLCNCSKGYQGNPYLHGGCEDINECANTDEPPCSGLCLNTPGGFFCSCPRGTHGNPYSEGACYPNQRVSLVIIGIALGISIGLLLLLIGAAFIARKLKARRARKLKENFFKKNRGLLLEQLISSNSDAAERMKIFTLTELEKATNNFDTTRILGRGGHGTVYKGILSDQRVVAIKKAKIVVQREIDDFINEVAILSQVNHRNVVKLFGCCLETEVPLLVYEFISNGTLSDHLHVQSFCCSLSWDDRMRIALETARAIAYLHTAASISVFHRDIKSANILLTDSLTAKVSDFGASRSVSLYQTGVTTVIQGTYGYLDPEYYYTSRLTEKSDVFSFGVILAELLTRQKPLATSRLSEGQSLAAYFVYSTQNQHLFEILDPQILEEGKRVAIEAVAGLAEMCLRMKGEERPTMKEVEVKLETLRGSKKELSHPQNDQRMAESRSLPNDSSTESNARDMTMQHSLETESLLLSLPR